MRKQTGFTIIELVIVIAILAILAATALPRFIDLSDEAEAAALAGVVGNIESASAINYAGALAGDTSAATTDNMACSAAVAAILQGGIPDGYAVTGTIPDGSTGDSTNCTVIQDDNGNGSYDAATELQDTTVSILTVE